MIFHFYNVMVQHISLLLVKKLCQSCTVMELHTYKLGSDVSVCAVAKRRPTGTYTYCMVPSLHLYYLCSLLLFLVEVKKCSI